MIPSGAPAPTRDPTGDLGLGGKLAQQHTSRLLNRDGSFNVYRRGQRLRDFVHPYHLLLTMSWPAFFLLVVASYVLVNAFFAAAYVMCGPGALAGAEAPTLTGRLANAFYFSVQTLATIGYGKMTPEGTAANTLVSLEALLGLLGFALITGILFARFSRPTAKILFSATAAVSPYRGISALMFRIANGRSNELSEVRATVTLARFEEINGSRTRRFYQLALEREKVVLFPMQWVVVHPIDKDSPLHGYTPEMLAASDAEILILMSALDETFTQTVSVRSSYRWSEIRWGVRFSDMTVQAPDGSLEIDLARLGETEPAPLPSAHTIAPTAVAKL